MPANLTPQFYKAQQRLQEAKTTEEKIAIIEEMISLAPKHKGTEHLLGQLRTKLAKLKEEGKKGGAKARQVVIQKLGAGTVIFAGPPNSGKSTLFKALTGRDVPISDMPFSTKDYYPGVLRFENVTIQLVDSPPIMMEFADAALNSVIRQCDALALVLDASSPTLLEDYDMCVKFFEEKRIKIFAPKTEIASPNFLIRTMVGLTKFVETECSENVEAFKSLLERGAHVITTNADFPFDDIPGQIFKLLNIMRIYCKPQGSKVDYDKPEIVPIGSTVEDFARELQKDFAKRLRQAKLFNDEFKSGMFVPRTQTLKDGDTVELILG